MLRLSSALELFLLSATTEPLICSCHRSSSHLNTLSLCHAAHLVNVVQTTRCFLSHREEAMFCSRVTDPSVTANQHKPNQDFDLAQPTPWEMKGADMPQLPESSIGFPTYDQSLLRMSLHTRLGAACHSPQLRCLSHAACHSPDLRCAHRSQPRGRPEIQTIVLSEF